jgi:hypothetical protein
VAASLLPQRSIFFFEKKKQKTFIFWGLEFDAL